MRPLPSLRRREQIRAVLQRGSRGRSDGLAVAALRSPGRPSRAALAVPRSVGGAVVRNRYKRRLRALLAERAPREHWDLVVRVDPGAPDDFHELERHLIRALRPTAQGEPR